jgi:hypothetical protein
MAGPLSALALNGVCVWRARVARERALQDTAPDRRQFDVRRGPHDPACFFVDELDDDATTAWVDRKRMRRCRRIAP